MPGRCVTPCARCDQLEAELAALRDELGLSRSRWLRLARELRLERRKAQLLAILEAARGRCVSRAFIASQVASERASDRVVDVHISWLRAKLGLEIPVVAGAGWFLSAGDRARLAGVGTEAEHVAHVAPAARCGDRVLASGEPGAADSGACVISGQSS